MLFGLKFVKSQSIKNS